MSFTVHRLIISCVLVCMSLSLPAENVEVTRDRVRISEIKGHLYVAIEKGTECLVPFDKIKPVFKTGDTYRYHYLGPRGIEFTLSVQNDFNKQFLAMIHPNETKYTLIEGLLLGIFVMLLCLVIKAISMPTHSRKSK